MGDRADGDAIHPAACDRQHIIERNTAAGFEQGFFADLIPQLHRMPVIIVEAGTYYGDGSGTPEGQKEFVEQVIQRLEATADAKGRGITYCDHKVYRQQ